MHEKSWMMLRLLLNRYHGGATESVLRGFSEEDSQNVLNQPIESNDVQPALAPPVDRIKHIHYSWFIPKLEKIPKSNLPLVLSLLPEPHATKLRTILKDKSKGLHLTAPMKSFLIKKLYPTFQLNEILPIAYLPHSEMTELTALDKNTLINLIDYLGLYDLGEEIRNIVDKKTLKQVYECLTHKKHEFLRQCLHQKEKLVTQRLQLESWDGNYSKLTKILHHRGMVRLGYALSGEHPDLIWHIIHILDTGRGDKLSRFINKKELPGVTKALKKQVLGVIKFFKKTSKK